MKRLTQREYQRILQNANRVTSPKKHYSPEPRRQPSPDFPFHPTINKKSQNMHRQVSDLYFWQYQLTNKRNYMQNKQVTLHFHFPSQD